MKMFDFMSYLTDDAMLIPAIYLKARQQLGDSYNKDSEQARESDENTTEDPMDDMISVEKSYAITIEVMVDMIAGLRRDLTSKTKELKRHLTFYTDELKKVHTALDSEKVARASDRASLNNTIRELEALLDKEREAVKGLNEQVSKLHADLEAERMPRTYWCLKGEPSCSRPAGHEGPCINDGLAPGADIRRKGGVTVTVGLHPSDDIHSGGAP